MNAISAELQAAINTIFDSAERYRAEQVHDLRYLESDEGIDYCAVCAEKQSLTEGGVRTWGGNGADHDCIPHCYGCGCTLDGWLTDYGATDELGCLENEFDLQRDADCYAWMLCENSFPYNSEKYSRLVALIMKD